MSLKDVYRDIERDLETVEDRLYELSRSRSEEISAAVSEILAGGGKRLRPALLLLAAGTCNGDVTGPAHPAAGERKTNLGAAMELIHLASLIHDDVIDNASVRRGTSTISAGWGNKTAILVGDHVYSKAINVLAQDGDLEVIKCVAEATCRMTESEMMQSVWRNDAGMTEEMYLGIIAGKTASLISCSCRVGAMLSNVRDGEPDRLGDYGLNLGMAFQITDDLLDIRGDERKLGKPRGSDLREGSLTLPFIYAMSVAGEGDREWMIRGLEEDRMNEDYFGKMRKMAQESGGIEYSLQKAKEYCATCKDRLMSIGESASRDSLMKLADHVIDRVA